VNQPTDGYTAAICRLMPRFVHGGEMQPPS